MPAKSSAPNDNSPMVLTIDVGSSSLRTNLYTAGAEQVSDVGAQLSYDVRVTPDGGVEIDPEALLACLLAAIDETLERAGEGARRIEGVGMCSLVSNVMGVDAEGRPTTPIYTWADTRCAREAAELRAEMDEGAVRERTGCPIHTSYLPARLLWLKRERPEAHGRTATWVSLGEWLQLKLLGRAGQSLSVASWGGLLNRHTLDWDAEWLSYLEIDRARLPRLVDFDEPMRGLRDEYAERWPALGEVPWYPCLADGVTGNLGSGCSTPEDVAVQVGTSGAMRAVVPGTPPTVPEGLWCYRVDQESSLLGGALSEGGNVLAWVRDTLRVDDMEALEQEVARMEPDGHGLTVLPFLAGERSPGWAGEARGAITGISLGTTPADIMRATQEAITYRFGLAYDLLRPALPPTRRVVASGAALLNVPGWTAVLADVLGTPVTALAEKEASSRGTALLVLKALGILDPATTPARLGQTYAPDMQRHAVYRQAMARQREMEGVVKRKT
ncbi:MAG: gluconokinase [Chloroflexia bacterium]